MYLTLYIQIFPQLISECPRWLGASSTMKGEAIYPSYHSIWALKTFHSTSLSFLDWLVAHVNHHPRDVITNILYTPEVYHLRSTFPISIIPAVPHEFTSYLITFLWINENLATTRDKGRICRGP